MQAIQGSAEAAATVLERGGDRAIVARNLARIPNLCKSTGTRLGTLVEWLRPDAHMKGPARDCIEQCVELAGEDMALRGIEVAVDTGTGTDTDIDTSAMRELVVTALLVLADAGDQPMDITVALRTNGEHIDVSLQARMASRVASLPRGIPAPGNCLGMTSSTWQRFAVFTACANRAPRCFDFQPPGITLCSAVRVLVDQPCSPLVAGFCSGKSIATFGPAPCRWAAISFSWASLRIRAKVFLMSVRMLGT